MSDTRHTELWSSLSKKSRYIETGMDALTRKRTGSYYTDLKLTDVMMSELVEHLKAENSSEKLYEYRFLEPCVGTGNFVFSYIEAIRSTGLDKEKAQIMLENIYVADVNADALNCYKESLTEMAALFWGIELQEEYFERHMGTGVLVDVTAEELSYISVNEIFSKEIVGSGFDIVATNPPYKNLKAERGHYGSDEEYNREKDKYSAISKIVSKRFKYSTDGVLNLYKLFAEEIIDRYANKTAFVSLLIPASIMSDKTCMKLRTHMLKDNKMISVKVIGEGSGYIDAQQALSAILLQKCGKTDKVAVVKDYCNNPDDAAEIEVKDIMNKNTGNAIVAVSSKEYRALRKLRQFPAVKELPFVNNLRGELDLTANKNSIVAADTGYPLVRGRNIGYYNLLPFSENEYVAEEFVNATKKKCYIETERIICQQIANMNKERRVTFALAPRNYVLGNSCNFISVSENSYGIDIYTLLGLFNTKLINRLFKLTSSNNHVNNYEIDCFPIPVEAPELKRISALAAAFLDTQENVILEEIEQLAYRAYGIISSAGE
ncbi:MAG: Alw26I/Eco31I/Esp3I family type II restriction adenine-specific DNA-methyltransferase [Ruminococcus sp.]|nr:Alw26I/Eco31I/Esp3I family type II restriction adenine-specific DNA-methyltransferase [Ruminococcus sp.]